MKKTELEMVGWFKAELRSYYHDAPRIKYLESKLKQLNNRFEAHSPNLSGMPGGSVTSHDEKLAEWIEEKEAYEKELRLILQKRSMVEFILDRIEPEYVEPLRMIYSGKQNIAFYAYRAHRSVRGYKHHINMAILRALTKG